MPNMSYCQFENTGRAINQLIATMKDARSYRDLDLNEHEETAWRQLTGLCEEVMALQGDLEETRGDEQEYTSVKQIGTAATPIPEDLVLGLDKVAIKQVRDLAFEAFNADLEGENAGYFETLAGAIEDELYGRGR